MAEALAKAEMWAASTATAARGYPWSLERQRAHSGAAYWTPVGTDPKWEQGVWYVLRWLVGEPDVHGRVEPPMPLPERNTQGNVLTAQELYDVAIAAEPNTRWGPEERRALRVKVEAEALRSRRLAALIEETKRSVGTLP